MTYWGRPHRRRWHVRERYTQWLHILVSLFCSNAFGTIPPAYLGRRNLLLSMESWMATKRSCLCAALCRISQYALRSAKVPAKCRRYASAARAWSCRLVDFLILFLRMWHWLHFAWVVFPLWRSFFLHPLFRKVLKKVEQLADGCPAEWQAAV